jgi:hypothetical protein
MRRLGVIFYVLAAMSLLAALASIVFGPEWIEVLTGLDPDRGSGSLEALMVVLPGAGAIVLGGSGYGLRRLSR